MTNLAHQCAVETCISVPHSMSEYEGYCLEWCDDFGKWLDARNMPHDLLWIEHSENYGLVPSTIDRVWREHCVLSVDGRIHDLWHPEVLTPWEYLRSMFPPGVGVSMELR
jgi:hypothetical protein